MTQRQIWWHWWWNFAIRHGQLTIRTEQNKSSYHKLIRSSWSMVNDHMLHSFPRNWPLRQPACLDTNCRNVEMLLSENTGRWILPGWRCCQWKHWSLPLTTCNCNTTSYNWHCRSSIQHSLHQPMNIWIMLNNSESNWSNFINQSLPVVPRKAVAEVSKIGNLYEVGSCEWWIAERMNRWTDSSWRQRSGVVIVVEMYL